MGEDRIDELYIQERSLPSEGYWCLIRCIILHYVAIQCTSLASFLTRSRAACYYMGD